jgi:hypothetical protein
MSRPAPTAKLKPLSVNIRGKRWRVFFEKPPKEFGGVPGDWGMCNYEHKKIFVDPNGPDIWGTYIHEIFHAATPDFCEDAVDELETTIVSAILKYPTDLLPVKP